ncbi:MAG: helix-turn-helix domain-containing protein [Rhizobium sp.]|nr:helix-turn-helix domain-containing protein [Rhizobium sp.]
MKERNIDPAATVPTYELYGERDAASAQFRLHCETIPARSSLHHWEIGLHRHEHFFQILLITGGSGDAVYGDEIVRFEPVSVLTVPPAVGHGFRFSPDIDGFVFTVLASRLPVRPGEPGPIGAFLSAPRATRLTDQRDDGGLIRATLERVAEEWNGRRSGRSVLMETGLATALVLTARLAAQDANETEVGDDNDRRIEALLALLHREVRQHRPASFYAETLGISPTHLNRVVKEKTGISTQALIARRLLEEAQRELLFTPGSVQEVAFRLGFADPAYFSRFFTRQAGMTPRSWKRQEQKRLGSRSETDQVTSG